MRWMLAAVALAAAIPGAAQAQQPGLPLWEVGTWCMTIATDVTACIHVEAPKDEAMISVVSIDDHGRLSEVSRSVMTIEEGRAVERSAAAGTVFREVSRGPNALVMENRVTRNVAGGDAARVRFALVDGELIAEITAKGETSEVQHYKRMADAQPVSFDWLAGDWKEDVAGTWTTEHWQAQPDGTMTGTGSSGHDQVVKESEAMTITLDGNFAVFTALPKEAQAPTPFREIARGPQDVTFANAGHDYPQRIRYWREGDALLAEISMADGSKAMRWRYTRVK